MKRAFTLIELLVVIGIVGILMAVVVPIVTDAPEDVRAAKCLTCMSNLVKGALNRAMDREWYPLAGSVERFDIDESQGVRNAREAYNEAPGWISWYSNGAYRGRPSSHTASEGWYISCYEQDEKKRLYCLTNGTLWAYVNKNAGVYVCPSHERRMPKDLKPAWSYFMNGYFGYDDTYGAGSKSQFFYGIKFGSLNRADRRLMFAEIPWAANDTDKTPDTSTAPGTALDCTLHYKDRDGEVIGFDHQYGDKWAAHVAFADGHTEILYQPRLGLERADARELTKWLCEGRDVSFNGRRYEEVK